MREIERQEDGGWWWAVEVCVFEERRARDVSSGYRERNTNADLLVLIKDVESFYCAHCREMSTASHARGKT
jgi:hypothetical protein